MAEPQTANVTALPATAPKLGLGQCFLQGKISYTRVHKGESGKIHLTILKIAAPDAYSHPSTVEVSSHEKLGEVNDEWKGVCSVVGYPRSYDQKKTDPETGEIEVKTVRTATISLRVAE